ncbi:hypothetical protein FPHOBKDP_00102 [Listeria phage LPJP1]|nr:hypothetical protein FPHOBKDP_00102 [Listeria phage LPJP1]
MLKKYKFITIGKIIYKNPLYLVAINTCILLVSFNFSTFINYYNIHEIKMFLMINIFSFLIINVYLVYYSSVCYNKDIMYRGMYQDIVYKIDEIFNNNVKYKDKIEPPFMITYPNIHYKNTYRINQLRTIFYLSYIISDIEDNKRMKDISLENINIIDSIDINMSKESLDYNIINDMSMKVTPESQQNLLRIINVLNNSGNSNENIIDLTHSIQNSNIRINLYLKNQFSKINY